MSSPRKAVVRVKESGPTGSDELPPGHPSYLRNLGLKQYPSPAQAIANSGLGNIVNDQLLSPRLGQKPSPAQNLALARKRASEMCRSKPHEESFDPQDFTGPEREQLSMIAKLLNGHNPTAAERTSSAWCDLAEILADMPHEFRKMALLKFEEGICIFGKVPVITYLPEHEGDPMRIRVVGPARPMGCPEPPPADSEFILAWREGGYWNWNLPDFEFGWQMISDTRFQPRLRLEYEKYDTLLRALAESGNSVEAPTAAGIMDLMGSLDRGPIGNSDKVIGFYAGVLFARLLLYSKADQLYAENLQPKKSEWPEILRHALDRHGWDMSAEKLLAALRGKVLNNRALTTGPLTITFDGWPHLPKEKLTFKQFSKKMTDLKTKHKQLDPERTRLLQIREMLQRARRIKEGL